jgi:hypothetical protein
MRDSQPFTQGGWPKRFATEDFRQKSIAIGNFAQRHQPHCKLANGLITAGIVRLHADSTGMGQGRQVHKILTLCCYCLAAIVADKQYIYVITFTNNQICI